MIEKRNNQEFEEESKLRKKCNALDRFQLIPPIKSSSIIQISRKTELLPIKIDSVEGSVNMEEIIQKGKTFHQKKKIVGELMPSQFLRCSKCDCSNFDNEAILLEHYLDIHQYCMKCKFGVFSNASRVEHEKCVSDVQSFIDQQKNVDKNLTTHQSYDQKTVSDQNRPKAKKMKTEVKIVVPDKETPCSQPFATQCSCCK